MATAAYIQGKIYYGYSKAASRLGFQYDIYRSATPITPILAGNIIGNVYSSFNVSWDYMKSNKYGNAVWQTVADGREFQVGDFLVNFSLPVTTYFIIAMELMLPILSVECNKVITIERPAQNQTPGFQGTYAGYEPNTSLFLAQNLPASILFMNRGMTNKMKLPTDARLPIWTLLIPNLGDVQYKNGDIVIDELNMRYEMISPELTDFGWRILIEQLGA